MAPAATIHYPPVGTHPLSPTKRGWTEERAEIPSILVGRGQENTSTARHNLEEGMDSERHSTERARSRGRQNSLQRVKDSKEVLRQRSPKAENRIPGPDMNSSTREGRNFTVANVGNNGKIYLRPTPRQPLHHQMPPSAYRFTPSPKARGYDTDTESTYEKKRWSDTQASRTPTRPSRAHSTDRGRQRSNSASARSVKLSRSDSMSTIDANNLDRGQFKVMISHGSPAPDQVGEKQLPTLEVPIPHYRLGTPRFSTRGTAFLHSQVYSRASTNDEADSSAVPVAEYDALFPVPPGMDSHGLLRRHSDDLSQPHIVQATVTPPAARIPITTSPVYHRAKEPIVPSIYDAIAANPDDPAIVRYAMTTREISAASPARLIAQITSKNFLDYELLSDFFLTVRAYLSSHDLLAYLLTRFEWAVNRFDDDGRVIRVRAFAAIRHWILNYFPYDFVVDRDLRVKFCQHLNALTHQVRQRSSHEPSDLKLIVDLKKCWNGRCALFWDSPMGDAEGRNDLDISPGGIVGSRDSQLTHPNELWARIAESSSQQVDQAKSVATLSNWVDSVIEADIEGKARSERGVSTTTSRSLAMSSPLSEQSIPAMSCSIPGRTLKAYATQSPPNVGPHPVPTAIPSTLRRAYPAAQSAHANEKVARPNQEHKRSGSFSDALRDKRTSLPTVQSGQPAEQVVMTFPFSGSLVRGSVLPPGSPFIVNLAPHESASSLPKNGNYVSGIDSSKVTVRPLSPGVKNLLSTIRRAIGTKQSSNTPTPNLLSTAPFMVETKSTTLPMHIAYKIEGSGDQHHQLEALKKNLRIDLLCADVTEMFERAMCQEQRPVPAPTGNIGLALGNEREQPSPDQQRHLAVPEREALQRNHSEVTYGSQSIVIVDDTGLEPPVPNLPSTLNKSMDGQHQYESLHKPSSTANPTAPPLPAAFEPLIPAPPSDSERGTSNDDHTAHSALLPPFTIPTLPESPSEHQNSGMSDRISRVTHSHRPRPSITTRKSIRSSRSGPGSLRRYASYQSGMRRSGPDYGLGSPTAMDSPPGLSKLPVDQPPGRMLRRRPGGDLRANENVHDLEPLPRPKSTGSINTYTESIHSSGGYLKRVAPNTTASKSYVAQPAPVDHSPVSAKKTVSLVSTRPSQPDLRPSFEAAVAEFARIPDDDGGDLEATLLKLEGKFRKSPVGSSEGVPPVGSTAITESNLGEHHVQQSKNPKSPVLGHEPASGTATLAPPDIAPGGNNHGQSPRDVEKHGHRDTMARSLYAESEESYNSTPLLERGLSEKSKQQSQSASDRSNITVPQPLFSPSQTEPGFPTQDQLQDSAPSAPSAEEDEYADFEAFKRARYRSSMPTCTTDSFLLDEDEFLSDLSSEISEDPEAPNTALDGAFAESARFGHGGQLPHNVSYAQGYLPSPPMTTENAMAITSETNRIQDQLKPPTPEPSPVNKIVDPCRSRTPGQVDDSVLQPFATTVHHYPPRRHIPFVLAYDADILAQQFTIIERDALNEINWQDLIDMRWQNTSGSTLNWVEYLRFHDPTGIDLVTARFNIVVKWALSEIVLTHNIEERALTIIKYIHIAQQARKYHNYATLLQLTIALTSVDCSRMTKTWDLVPAAEQTALKEMERLVTPIRNFHNLRQEMESANLDNGCIPVIVIYIHDLTYNAQKPSVIASTRYGEPLINFERYRTTATIVKGLLRLIDASAKYDFRPVEGALDRCLWMASLSDDMIRAKSKEVET